MNPSVRTFLIILSFAGPVTVLRGQQQDTKGITAPVGCKVLQAASCGSDITSEQARKSYARIVEARKECQSIEPHKRGILDHGPGCSPLETLTDFNLCGEAGTLAFDYYYWAPLEAYTNGKQVLEEVIARAAKGQVFAHAAKGQVLENNYQIVRAAESTRHDRHYALCQISKIGATVGPPRNCVTVAVLTRDKVWLRGGYRQQLSCFAASSIRPSGAIDIYFDISTTKEPDVFAAGLKQMLMSDLKLAVEQRDSATDYGDKSIYLTSAAGIRDSSILSGGWRETLDFDLLISRNSMKISVRGTAHVMTNRLASGNLTEYSGLSDVQRNQYASALDLKVRDALRKACPSYRQMDSSTIECK